jgi:hypothetical protein
VTIVGGIRSKEAQPKRPMNMATENISRVVKPAHVKIKSLDGTVIDGKVSLGYENRMSDLLTKTDNPFIVVFDAMYVGSPKKKVLVLNKQHIVWAEPEEQEREATET